MLASGLLLLALLGQAQPRTYYWRDAAGQTHITNTPPPADAQLLQSPPPPAVEPGRVEHPEPIQQSLANGRQVVLSPVQKEAWDALELHLAKARSADDRRTLEAVAESLVHDCLWGKGLWARPLLPLLALLLLGLSGWWVALGLQPQFRAPLVGGFLVVGLACGHLLLNRFLYQPQAARLRQNLELLEGHMGLGRDIRPERRALLEARYQALERAASPLRAPWSFPTEVASLAETMKQVMVAP